MARRRFTDGRVPDPGVRALQAADSRWQAYLDVEAALALAQADEGVVPADAAVELRADVGDAEHVDEILGELVGATAQLARGGVSRRARKKLRV